MLAACYLFQQGTPFIYQGQEIGMTNIRLSSIDQYKDVASIHAYHAFYKHGSEEKRMHRIHLASRDSARTPMQWSVASNAGFSSAQPWFAVNPNYTQINVEQEERDPDSILNFYRRCLALRKSSQTLLWGDYREYCRHSRKIYLYVRSYAGERVLVICSFSERDQKYLLPKGYTEEEAALLLCNYPEAGTTGILRPYEVRVFQWGSE